jgi:hypothetical protein
MGFEGGRNFFYNLFTLSATASSSSPEREAHSHTDHDSPRSMRPKRYIKNYISTIEVCESAYATAAREGAGLRRVRGMARKTADLENRHIIDWHRRRRVRPLAAMDVNGSQVRMACPAFHDINLPLRRFPVTRPSPWTLSLAAVRPPCLHHDPRKIVAHGARRG